MTGLANKREQTHSCACGTTRTKPPRSHHAVEAAELAAAEGLPLTASLRDVRDPRLLRIWAMFDVAGACRLCGWPRAGRKLDPGAWSA